MKMEVFAGRTNYSAQFSDIPMLQRKYTIILTGAFIAGA
jgi:hypothetical protein